MKIPGLKGTLFPFQRKGVRFLDRMRGRGLLADQMGLGKTIQTLAWLQKHPKFRPAVLVVPCAVKLNWGREAKKWMKNPRVQILSGKRKEQTVSGKRSIFIINYDILANQYRTYWVCPRCKKKQDCYEEALDFSKCLKCSCVPDTPPPICKRQIKNSGWVDCLCGLQPSVVVLDECHFLKSPGSQRTRAVKRLCKKVPHIIALSGTPIINRPIEIYGTLKLLQPGLFPSRWEYGKRYCDLKTGHVGFDFSGNSHSQSLHRKLSRTVMIRRLKEDVLSELPEKTRSIIPLSLDNQAEYNEAEQDFISWLGTFDEEKAERASRAKALARIEGLKQLIIKGKLKGCIGWIKDFLESGEKLVVFCTHRKTLKEIQLAFAVYAMVVFGGQSAKNRQISIDNFQTSEIYRIIVCNIKAGGIGINLHAASNVCFVELEWSPSLHDQAEDRVHRIGQKASSVNAWYLLAADTIEEEIVALLDKKRKVLSQVLDGKDVEEESMLTELLDKYKKEK